VPIDNKMYDRLSHTWWDEDGFLNILKSGLNPARFGYMRRVLTETVGLPPKGLAILDVGCGGGLLAEEFATLGCSVTGVDPSQESLEVARAHARELRLDIDYRPAVGEDLPFDDAAFPAVYCCDVLEHVEDLGRTLAEIARVTRPGGVFLYDTINRTLRSKLLMIKLSQEWRATAWAEPDLHDFNMFIRPQELEDRLERSGFDVRDLVGFSAGNPVVAAKAMWDRAHGRITYAELGERLGIRESRDVSSSYGGYALKREGSETSTTPRPSAPARP
jgi:2-polyprenyl-6-hydroxyphenyl methylase/3-demethylubiquinone-9 3-methyltransferase